MTSRQENGVVTRASIASDLQQLGIEHGQSVLVHASLRGIGAAEWGPAPVAAAILDALGPEGTIVVLTATADNSDTSRIHLANTRHMNEVERTRYLADMPAYDPAATPSVGVGALAEYIRTAPTAQRSAHPQTSFAAIGPSAAFLTADHAADCHFGEQSPLAKLYKADAAILLIGVGYDACTALHLAEYRYTAEPPRRHYRCVVERNGCPTWWCYEDVVLDDGDFAELGRALDRTRHVSRGRIGRADSRVISLREAVDFAADWLAERRKIRTTTV